LVKEVQCKGYKVLDRTKRGERQKICDLF